MAMAIAFTLLLVLLLYMKIQRQNQQHGGVYDPYQNVRPMPILDFLRTFWLTG